LNKNIIKKYTSNISEIWSKGNSIIETSLYNINLGDWISWYLAEMNGVDAVEIEVINYLKNELKNI
jgi:glucose/mannose-6-phosphate isomerase